MRKIILYFIMLSILGLGCGKQVLDENPDFEGVWKSECLGHGCDSYTLIIESDNTGEYITSGQEIENVTYKGKIRIKDDILKIGLNHKFNILIPPTEKNDTAISYCQCLYMEEMVYSWYMIIDKITYYKE